MSIDVEQQCVWVLVICRDRVSEFDAIVKVVIQLLLSNGESHQGHMWERNAPMACHDTEGTALSGEQYYLGVLCRQRTSARALGVWPTLSG